MVGELTYCESDIRLLFRYLGEKREMDAMAESEEGCGVDLVPRKSTLKNSLHKLSNFDDISDGPAEIHDSKSKFGAEVQSRYEDVVEEYDREDEAANEEASSESLFGGSHKAVFQNQGSEIQNGHSIMEDNLVSDLSPTKYHSDHSVEDDITPKSSLETDIEYLENPKDEKTSSFSSSTAKTLNEDQVIDANGHSHGIIKPDESIVLEESKEELTEFDVERVLQKQETHDLFCPNCNSCITKRVILRRRKRKIQEISPAEELVILEPNLNPSPQEPEIIEEPNMDTERDAFRCLECFSIFIRLGRDLKLFISGGRISKETIRDAPQLSRSDTPASVPATETAEIVQDEQQVVSAQEQSSFNQQELLPELGIEPSLLTSSKQEMSMAVDAGTRTQLTKVASMALPAEQALSTKLDADVNSICGAAAEIDEIEATKGQQEGLQILIHRTEATAVPSMLDPSKVVTGIENVDTGNQVVVSVVEEPDQTVVSVSLPTHTSPETEALLPLSGTNTSRVSSAPPTTEADRANRVSLLDIIRSIVYGGLLESIASLSVVTSAAGANTKTLNILALGAANMFGGLFILAHNLRVMKHETNNERYEEVLGEPGHFPVHSSVAVLSYLVFGLLPPVIYGFTFRDSDNRDYKLIAVALASLLCIIILSLGKAYARRSPKDYLKTITYYTGLWVVACGVSYVAGDLFDLLLEKLGLFESSSSLAMVVGGERLLKTTWVSY